MVPHGFLVINASFSDERRREGLTISYRDNLKVKLVMLQMSPSTFEVLVVKLVVSCERFLLANIYWSPGVDIIAFLDELSDMKEFLSMTRSHLILLGDFNCSGALPSEIDEWLDTWLSCLNLVVVNDDRTRMHGDRSTSKLDFIIKPEQARCLLMVNTSPVGFSDH